ncbi:MAG: class II glutamine amidotransferase [Pseudomonadota bacterium]|nr:class II glutamine amidotransferase [Pseudomonadota bacterium]
MCRALLYLGEPVLLDNLLFQPDSALVRQSYMPKMLHMLNLAGFGMRAWDPGSHDSAAPFSYASDSLPVFDRNLKNLATKVAAGCVLAHVRGVAYSTQVEISLQNVHPFQFPGVPLALAHNGDLARFAELRPRLAAHVKPELARHVRGTTDSEWIYALVVSQLEDPHAPPTGDQLVAALSRALAIIREERRRLGIDVSSSVNLFLTDGRQVAAARYCFDFGRYPTGDPTRMHEANLGFLSLWYTAGRDYGLHDEEWKMTGGAENADSILIASEPLTKDVASWVEVPEYSLLHAEILDGRPRVAIHYLD